MGLDPENEIRNMRKEAIQSAISKKEKASLETMSLNELRSLDDDDEIPEPKDVSESAVVGAAGAPGGDLGLGAPPPGLPGLDLGGAAPGSGAPPSL
jgi:hypothetical protein